MKIIAEIKAGPGDWSLFTQCLSMEDRVLEYAKSADMISYVATHKHRGSLDGLRQILTPARREGIPVLRKDWTKEPHEIFTGPYTPYRLLIHRGYPDHTVRMAKTMLLWGMKPVLESCTRTGLRECLNIWNEYLGTGLVGFNCRSEIAGPADFDRFLDNADLIPHDTVPTVAMSGISTRKQIEQLEDMGYDHALVGTALMESDEPDALIRHLRGD